MNLQQLVKNALKEDIGKGDWTTQSLVDPNCSGTAQVFSRSSGVISGIGIFTEVFHQIDETIIVETHLRDGDAIQRDEIVLCLTGRLAGLLTGERTALNFLGRMSGIAGMTRRFVDAVAGTGVEILDTRKTTPLLRELEKAAVRHGGGGNHRSGLYDMILIKENHIAAAGGIPAALRKVQEFLLNAKINVPIEIEVRNLDELKQVLEFRFDRIMLDNFRPETARQAVEIVNGRCPLEISGGVNLENICEFAQTGVQYISVGALTHSAPAHDFSMIIRE